MKGLLRVTGKTGWEVRQETAPWSSDERLGEARSQDRPRWPARVARPGGPPRWPAQVARPGTHRAAHLLSTPATAGAKGPEGTGPRAPGSKCSSAMSSAAERDGAAGGCPGPAHPATPGNTIGGRGSGPRLLGTHSLAFGTSLLLLGEPRAL